MTSMFIRTSTGAIYDYFQLKAQPEFNAPNPTPGWPSTPEGIWEDFIDNYVLAGTGIERFYEVEAPFTEQWQVAEWSDPAYFQDTDGKWKRAWTVRNMTQQELDDLNQFLRESADYERAERYRMEADPLFFKAERQETTKQEWLDKVEQIRSEVPQPALVTIPE